MASAVNSRGYPFAILGLLFQIGLLFAYGFGSNYFIENDFSVGIERLLGRYFFSAVFVLLGFGMLLSFLQAGSWTGMATALFVISINIQLGILLQKFWFDVFDNNFNVDTQTISGDTNFVTFMNRNQRIKVQPNQLTFQIAVTSAISLLVSFTGFIGRIGLFQTFFTTIIFNIGWNLCYYCNIHVNITRSSHRTAFDDFGTDNVYIFGAFFGFMYCLLLNCQPARAQSDSYKMSIRSRAFGLIGTAFIFATFGITGLIYQSNRTDLSQDIAIMNLVFALSASVIWTYITSAIFRGGKVGIRQLMIGTISGGVIVGIISGLLVNIAAAIAVGSFAGVVSGFWYAVIHPKINKIKVVDSHGIFGAFMLVSILGGVVVAPVLLKVYVNLSKPVFNPVTPTFTDFGIAGLQLAYAGIAAGGGLVFGLIGALVGLCFRNPESDFEDAGMFHKTDFGLYNGPQKQKQTLEIVAGGSATHLKGAS